MLAFKHVCSLCQCMTGHKDIKVHHENGLTNQPVQSQGLSENQDQNHTDEQLGLLGVGPENK